MHAGSWDIIGYGDRRISTRYRRHDPPADSLAVILPGFGYTADAPLLFYAREVAWKAGYDVLTVDYRYGEDAEFLGCSEQEQERWFGADVAAVHAELRKRTGHGNLLLIGKSLGTTAMLALLGLGLPARSLRLVWLTPGISAGGICDYLRRTEHPSLYIAGTADEYYRGEAVELFRRNPRVRTLAVPNADHSLALADDLLGSIGLLQLAVKELGSFLDGR